MKPTREQIEQADEKTLRVMVAEMMGWERWTCDEYADPRRCLLFEPGTDLTGKASWERCGDEVPLDEYAWTMAGKWPVDLAAAMELLSAFADDGYAWKIVDMPGCGGPWPYITAERPGGNHATSEVLWCGSYVRGPLAERICRVVLCAWINEPDNPPENP